MFTDLAAFAVGILVSPFPVIPAILLLFSARPRANPSAYLGGWLVGLGTATLAFTLIAGVIADREPAAWTDWLRVLLGLALLVLAVRQWQGRHDDAEPPGWLRSIETAGPRQAGRLGLILAAANPKVLIFAAGAGLSIGAAELSAGQSVAAIVGFTAFASIAVAAPVVAYLILGDRILPPLGRARDWLERNNSAVTAVVLAVIGLLLIQKGFVGLRG